MKRSFLFFLLALPAFSKAHDRPIDPTDIQAVYPEIMKLLVAYYQKNIEPKLERHSKQQSKNCTGHSEKNHEKKQKAKQKFIQAATGIIGGFLNVVAGSITANPTQMINGVGNMVSTAVQVVTQRKHKSILRKLRSTLETSPSIKRK